MVPLMVAGGLLAAGAVGAAAASGVGRNKNTPQNFQDSKQYDANRYNFGSGMPGQSAEDYANRYQGLAQGWQNQAGTYNQQQGALFGAGQEALAQQGASRGGQAASAGMMLDRAMGGNLVSRMQADRAMNQANAAQASQMASARGPAAMALAQQGAANNMANMQTDIAGQSAIAASQEQLANMQAANAAYSNMRAGDLGAAGAAFGAGAQSGQLGLGAGGLGVQFGQLDNQVRGQQLQANLEQQRIVSGSQQQGQQLEAMRAQQNANNDKDMLAMGLGAAQGGLDAAGKLSAPAAAGGGVPARAAGGPVASGRPYLVGELGPELVVPARDGYVIPAHQTAGLLAARPAPPFMPRMAGSAYPGLLG